MAIASRFSSVAFSSTSSGGTIDKPAGVVENDMLLASVCINTYFGTETVSLTGGWTLIDQTRSTDGVNPNRILVFYKIAGSSEPSSYTLSLSAALPWSVGIATYYSTIGEPLIIDDSATYAPVSVVSDMVAPAVTTEYPNTIISCFYTPEVATQDAAEPPVNFVLWWNTKLTTAYSYAIWGNQIAIGVTGTFVVDRKEGNNPKFYSSITVAIAEDTEVVTLPAPTDLVATAISNTQINLTWTDNSTGETGFELWYLIDGTQDYILAGSPSANLTSFPHTGLSDEATLHTYKIRARYTDPQTQFVSFSEFSATASAYTFPNPPTMLSAVIDPTNSNQAIVTWTDNSNGETYQVIEHTLDRDDDPSDDVYEAGATLSPDVEIGTDNALAPNTVYYFRVGACNVSGCSYSDQSESVRTGGSRDIQVLKAQLYVDWDRDGTYTDETNYFISARGSHRLTPPGQSVTGSQGQVAQCSIVIDNANKRFSSNNPVGALYNNIQSGKTYHVPVILNLSTSFGYEEYTRVFTGVARIPTEITLSTKNARTLTIDCRGNEELLLNKRQRTTQANLNSYYNQGTTESQFMRAVLTGEGLVEGVDFELDSGLHTIPWLWLDNESIIESLWQLSAVSGGRFYARKDGVLTYENAIHWMAGPHTSSQATYTRNRGFQSLELLWDETELAEEIIVTFTERGFADTQTIYESGNIIVAPGQERIVWGRFDEPVYAISTLTYTASTPGGQDLSGSITITPTYYAAAVKLSITSIATVDAYVVITITGNPTESLSNNELVTTSANAFWSDIAGRSRKVGGNKFLQTQEMAESILNILATRQETPSLVARMRGCPGDPTRTPGDRITIDDAELDLVEEDFIVTALAWKFSSSGYSQDIDAIRADDLKIDSIGGGNYFIVGSSLLNGGDVLF